VLAVKARSALILGNGLVDGEVHLPALVGLSILDFPASVAKGSEDLILWVVDQNVAIGKVQDLGAVILTGPVPADVPQLPANLEGHDGLAGSRRHSEQDPALTLENGLHFAVDGNLLVV